MSAPESENTEVKLQNVTEEIDPIIDLHQSVFIYFATSVEAEKSSLIEKIQSIAVKLNMRKWYASFCAKANIEADLQFEDAPVNENMQVDGEESSVKIDDAEVEEKALANLRTLFNDMNTDEAVEMAQKLLGENHRGAFKVEICFLCARYGFIFAKAAIISEFIDKATQILENYTDWEQRNRLRVYEGLNLIRAGQYSRAVQSLLASVATFRSAELMSYKAFISITVVFALVTLDRPTLKKQVIQNSEITAMLQQIPSANRLLRAFHECMYTHIFSALLIVADELSMNAFIAHAVPFITEEIEIRALNQFLEAYQSVRLTSMAASFGLSPESLEAKLFKHTSEDRIFCRIDRRTDQVLAQEKDDASDLYAKIMKQGSAVEAKLRKLSKLLGV